MIKYLSCFLLIGILYNVDSPHIQRLGVIVACALLIAACFIALGVVFGSKGKAKGEKEQPKQVDGLNKLLIIVAWFAVIALICTKVLDPWLNSLPK